eukprot:c52320_g1_i1.p1 GENE.c52320_g1_i1~~c52320_g1_i1.p1  ORF type:complete len:436 (-),score=83.15 c52320_g1_i1:123-1430(-)
MSCSHVPESTLVPTFCVGTSTLSPSATSPLNQAASKQHDSNTYSCAGAAHVMPPVAQNNIMKQTSNMVVTGTSRPTNEKKEAEVQSHLADARIKELEAKLADRDQTIRLLQATATSLRQCNRLLEEDISKSSAGVNPVPIQEPCNTCCVHEARAGWLEGCLIQALEMLSARGVDVQGIVLNLTAFDAHHQQQQGRNGSVSASEYARITFKCAALEVAVSSAARTTTTSPVMSAHIQTINALAGIAQAGEAYVIPRDIPPHVAIPLVTIQRKFANQEAAVAAKYALRAEVIVEQIPAPPCEDCEVLRGEIVKLKADAAADFKRGTMRLREQTSDLRARMNCFEQELRLAKKKTIRLDETVQLQSGTIGKLRELLRISGARFVDEISVHEGNQKPNWIGSQAAAFESQSTVVGAPVKALEDEIGQKLSAACMPCLGN